LGVAGGLLALLTPCVFPMIPLTVSFFTKSSSNRRKGFRNATMYGAFILLVYLLLSVPFHLMEGISSGILNDISTNVYLNVAFFLIFLFFAFSFFGYYELTLPASWANKASSAEGIGGIIGIFFMALTLALVSFSCTGPILGSLLAGALTAEGGALQLSAGMGGFGLALALPFAVFAAFPSMMNALPKSGGWLNTVKVTLGFLELALALKFLSNADLVKHWAILKIEPFLGLWILIFLGLGLYLFGFLRFPHDSPVKKLSWGRIGLGALSFAFVLYLASGFLYNDRAGTFRSLKLLSGLAPPAGYSFFHPSDCPQNLNCFKDLNEGLAYAREVDKPVMIDFTGYACVNCRKMEEHVWPEGQVYSTLKNDYVLISLYTDDKKPLPEDQQRKVEGFYGSRDNVIRTYGHKWQYFQDRYFGAVAQPYYVLITPDGELLNNPVGYTPDANEYARFLECGKDAYQRLVDGKKGRGQQLGVK
jgi:thiol:disulfide interchange protein